ncbi:MAG: Ig-like domain repeat protein [Burkholderiales bacterium]
MSANPTTAFASQSVVLTATINPSATTGTVTFKDGTTTLGTGTLSAGVATLSTTFSTAGTHSLTVVYAGDATYATSTSSTVSETINARATTTTVLTSSLNPANVGGQNPTLTATVTGSSPTGTVTFKDGTTTLGTGTLSAGVATLVSAFTTGGTHNVTAVYGGDVANLASTSSTLHETVTTKLNTTLAIRSSANPTAAGAYTYINADITPSDATGSVTFKDGATTLGTSPLQGGSAYYPATFTTPGVVHNLTATYVGSSTYAPSTSPVLNQAVNPGTTTTTVGVSANPIGIGQPLTLSVAVSPTALQGVPTGIVTFKDGAVTLGTGTLNAGVATLQTALTAAGQHSLAVVYAGDAAYATSTSPAVIESVSASATATALTSSRNPVPTGQSTTLSAAVAGSSPTGTVTFKDGTTTLGTGTVTSGVATFAAAFSTYGAHSLTATYGGDANNLASSSAPLTETVNSGATAATATLVASPAAAALNQTVALTATVAPAAATGTVLFKDGQTIIGTASLSGGVATANTSFQTAGIHSLTAVYEGDGTYTFATSSAASETVATASSATALTSSINPANVGQSTTFTATVTGASPIGSVTFKDGTTILGTAPLTAGVATFSASFSSGGAHSITAIYGGDANNLTSTSVAVSETVTATSAASTSTLVASPATAAVSDSVTLTATVSPSAATGTMTFMDGATTLGTGTVNAGVATLVTTFNTAGTRALTVAYSGDATYSGSTSSAKTEYINPRNTQMALTSSVNPAAVGQSTTLTATITGTNPTGTVTFKDNFGATTLGTGTVTAGVATFPTSFLGGTHSLSAVYSGDANNYSVGTQTLSQAVNAGPTTTLVIPSVNPVGVGQSTTFAVTVTGASPFAPPSGTVTLRDVGTTIGTVNITAGVGTIATTFFATGGHNVVAQYGGDASNLASSSNTLVEAIPAGTTPTTTTMAVNPTTALVAQSIGLTATVSSASATGSVAFMEGTTVVGTAALNSGVATLNTSFSFAGVHSLQAVYVGDGSYASSTSSAVNETVTAQPTTTVLTSSVPTVGAGQSTVLTATIMGTPVSGLVTFKDGATILGTAGIYLIDYVGTTPRYQAQLGTTFATTGAHSLTAVYAGDTNTLASTSTALNETVTAGTTTTALTSSVNPANVAQSTTLTATVTGASPNGTVTFKDGTTTLGTGTLSGGVATLTASFSSSGVHSLTAVYGGDVNNLTSTAPAFSESVAGGTPTLALSTNQTTISAGQMVTLVATASGAPVAGDAVHFYDGVTDIGSAVVDAANTASLTIGDWTTGSHAVTARLVDVTFTGVVSPAVTLTASALSPVISLSSSRNPSNPAPYNGNAPGVSVTVTGMYVRGAAGTVITLRDGGTAIATYSPYIYAYGSVASFNFNFLPILSTLGVHNLTVTIDADAWNAAVTSPTLAETVGYTTSFDLQYSATPVAGQPLVLSVAIAGGSTSPAPTGTVTFKDGSSVIAVVAVASRAASTPFTPSGAGTHMLSANYSGDGGFTNLPSSATTPLNVLPRAGTVALSASLGTVPVAAPFTLTATVSAGATGSVTFSDEASTLGTATLSGGSATLNTSLATVGPHRLMASYSGDANNAADVSNFITIQVGTNGTPASPGNMTWLYGYDAVGSLITSIDPNANATQKFYDTLQRTSTLVQPLPAAGGTTPQVQFGYDGQDNLTSVKDPRNLTTSYTVNGLGDTAALASPDSGGTASTYDIAGNLKTRTDARGKTATFAYDVLNRLKSITYSTGTPTVFEYDGGTTPVANSIGKLSKITDESGTTTYTYDGFGNVATKTSTIVSAAGTKSFTVSYTWGTTGPATAKLVAIKYPSGTVVNYGYDATERLNAVTANPVNANGVGTSGTTLPIISAITYNGGNAIKGWNWSDGTAYQRGFDAFGRLASYPIGNPNGTGAAAGLLRTLNYDNAGRIVGYTHTRSGTAQPSFDQTFGYDGLDRLIQNTMANATYGFSYDQTGNRTSRVVGATTYANVVATTSNQLASVQSAGSGGSVVTNSQQYDSAGNLTGDGIATYGYGARGRMSSATLAGGAAAYLYNGLDQRASKTGPTALIATGGSYFAYDEAGQLLGEYDANLNPVYETAYIGSMPVAVLKQTGSAASSTLLVTPFNVWADHIATPRVVTRNTDQAIVWRWDSAEGFGATAPDQNPNSLGVFALNQRFPGQVSDAETGLLQNGYRYYDQSTGRYRSFDPIGLGGGINGYAYVSANPLLWVDPRGLDIAVIENGPTKGNPVGHTAVAVTGQGVYSSGNGYPGGYDLSAYLAEQAARRNTTVVVIKTTPEQDAAALEILKRDQQMKEIPMTIGNCSDRSNDALNAAKIRRSLIPSIFPGSSGMRGLDAGGTPYQIPKGTTSIPEALRRFDAGP